MERLYTKFKRQLVQIAVLRHRPLVHLLLWQFGCAKSETQTTDAERNCLAQFARGRKMLAEIGVYHGVTTCRLRNVMDSSGLLVAVDPYPKQRLGFSAERIIAHREVSKVRRGKVEWMRTTGAGAAEELRSLHSPYFDFVFIDGDHSWEGLQADWEGWRGLIGPGGIIALHDSRSTPSRVLDDVGSARFTREVIAHDRDFLIVAAVDSLTVLQRTHMQGQGSDQSRDGVTERRVLLKS